MQADDVDFELLFPRLIGSRYANGQIAGAGSYHVTQFYFGATMLQNERYIAMEAAGLALVVAGNAYMSAVIHVNVIKFANW